MSSLNTPVSSVPLSSVILNSCADSVKACGAETFMTAFTSIDFSPVLETVKVLRQRGWEISEAALVRGLEEARWPGRLELAWNSPNVILDGGHNPQCMEALARSLGALYPGKKLIFLTGVLADKNWTAMMEQLLPLAKEFYTITPDSPRAMSAAGLADWLESRGAGAVPCETVRDGLDRALAAAGPRDVVCACGSLYMIGEARHLLGLC